MFPRVSTTERGSTVEYKLHFHAVIIHNTGVYYSLYAEVSSELESKSGERLTALHSKLQQEAEKIRKWKNATEVEIKHKVCNVL